MTFAVRSSASSGGSNCGSKFCLMFAWTLVILFTAGINVVLGNRSELSGNDGDDSQSFSSFTCLVNLPDDKVCDCYSDCPGESDELFCSESTPEDRLQDQQQKLNKKRADQGTNFLLDLGLNRDPLHRQPDNPSLKRVGGSVNCCEQPRQKEGRVLSSRASSICQKRQQTIQDSFINTHNSEMASLPTLSQLRGGGSGSDNGDDHIWSPLSKRGSKVRTIKERPIEGFLCDGERRKIPYNYVCDGEFDCTDETDENPELCQMMG
ncbi:uncharacterized protein LOC142345458 [Convolutriloba macropyga]|uniref:uncharacterized protein LOC142345458 n=1 Tax=Convolutriloba macropyga TaxID=536237 RepID=UPI003F522E98